MKNSLLYKTILLFAIIAGIICVHKYKAERVTIDSDKPTIKIGVIFPLSGDSAIYGESAQAAAEVFMDELSKIDTKYNYEIIFEDNRQKLSETVNIAKKFITYDKVDVLITFLANFGMAVAPVAQEYKTPHFSVASVDPNIARG
ncbi:MAG: ABC transporter substrate-binding protein, partial [Lactobacillus sp.]|nr:ABC transporter substrate-binding protein [Lactobacillus sp.]